MATHGDYTIRYFEVQRYLKIVCATYMFPLYRLIHGSCIKELRSKLLDGINAKLQEDFKNVVRNKDYEYGLEQLEEVRKELDQLMIVKN
jgi:hypothetical protein